MEKYNAVIVGLGKIGWYFDINNSKSESPLTHAGAYIKNPNVKLAGGVSNDKEERMQFEREFNVPAFTSISESFDEINPDIVSICSPTEFHFEHTQECFKYGIPMVWLEKPPSGSLDELDQLIEMKKKSSSTVLVSYLRRYSPVYQRLKELYDTCIYGETIMVQLTYSKGLYVNGSHMLDTVFYLIGDEYDVSLDCVMPYSKSDNPSFSFSLSNRIPVIVTGLDLPYHCLDITLVCGKGRLSLCYGGMQGRVEVVTEQENFPGFYRLKETNDDILLTGERYANFPGALRDLMQSHKMRVEPASNLNTARKTQWLIEEILPICR